MNLQTVTFLMPTRIGTLYNTGEVAGFEPDVVKGLVAQGFATLGTADVDVPEAPRRFQGDTPVVATPVEITPRTAPITPALSQTPPAVEVPGNGAADAPAGSEVVIPDTWATMSAQEMKDLALQLGVTTSTKAEAQTAIEAAIVARKGS